MDNAQRIRELEAELKQSRVEGEIQGLVLCEVGHALDQAPDIGEEEAIARALQELKKPPPTWDLFCSMEFDLAEAKAEVQRLTEENRRLRELREVAL